MNKKDYEKLKNEIDRQLTQANKMAANEETFNKNAKEDMSHVGSYHKGRKEGLESLKQFLNSNWSWLR